MEYKERLNVVIKSVSITKKMFAERCGVSKSQLFLYLNGTQVPSHKFYEKLKEEFPYISLDWLISGKGKMIIDSPVAATVNTNLLKKIIEHVEHRAKKNNERLPPSIKSELITVAYELFYEIPDKEIDEGILDKHLRVVER